FEDDLNQSVLDAFNVLNAFAAIPISKHVEIFARAENILDTEIETGKTADGVTSVGNPFLFSAGVRGSFY
ncbi:MAG: hypothetical protein KDD66_18385, partial [Bdellovibrionales bacterium]|nr:hypothetical protein [Bdellovibrionales bacterium]